MRSFHDEYKEYLLVKIKPWCKPAGRNHVLTRCKYCSDSRTPSHGHMYISIPEDNSDEPSFFYCQKCHSTGIVTSKTIMDWGVYDSDITVTLSEYNKRVLSLSKNRKFKDKEVYYINNTNTSNDPLTLYKLNYINTRLGTSLSIDECIENKIVFNLNDLISENRLTPTRDARIIEALDSDFIGFLSYDNAFLNMRNLQIHDNLHSSINKRYVNYNIFDKCDNTSRVYVLPTILNLTDISHPIELHMAEGPFDILSIKYNVVKSTYNKIYAAILGSGYKGLIKFIARTLKTPNIIIHMYLDNDQNVDSVLDWELRDFLFMFRVKLYIHRNRYTGEKDFGVCSERIINTVDEVSYEKY